MVQFFFGKRGHRTASRLKSSFHDIEVSGFVFRYAANFPQRAAVVLHGKNNYLHNCVIERMSGYPPLAFPLMLQKTPSARSGGGTMAAERQQQAWRRQAEYLSWLNLSGAATSHATVGDAAGKVLVPMILAGLVFASWALRPESRVLRASKTIIPAAKPVEHGDRGLPWWALMLSIVDLHARQVHPVDVI